MLYDFINLDNSSPIPLYKQLYSSIRKAIENNGLTKGDKLVSIRALSNALGISKTTVEAAYSQLCAEGYIKNSPQRGFFIQGQVLALKEKTTENGSPLTNASSKFIKHDFSSKSVTVDSTGIKLWRKYVKAYLNKDYIISSYGDPQGEYSLRRALSFYSYSVRSVVATEEDIVIGAGTQSLLYLLCGLLRGFGTKIAVENDASRHFIRVFKDCGFEIVKIDSDDKGVSIDKIKNENPDFLLINPSGSLKSGDRIKMERRFELIEWAHINHKFIIEDDYNGELVYNSRSVPALQCSDAKAVIYLGSFSKLLLPSVRIGYMVLPEGLLEPYNKIKRDLNQTASKIEQLALADYIRDGQLERHLRRLKKSYGEKSNVIERILSNRLKPSEQYGIKLFETSLAYEITINSPLDLDLLNKKLRDESIAIISAENGNGKTTVKIGFSGIEKDDIEAAADKLCKIIQECK
ncbi:MULTISPECIES: PLP-dependent aminotransferase family protein [unclassified Ruminococcus]|uniref:MocR-like pyridoxine biosynthesis transcription factor PdxR n=1 Tax=unclassified Ruminococcus TaxID=2608920 RepID=UPI002109379F|nr:MULTISPECIES: PLP-dependent aminotransferase family protein [unclassified Ruminococcus]MCQ4022671.1 GntR family transcriptional regulator [Ruminococcus sp. zg-924]MCQ4114911.1 GntR family transcriptional regulator [Ruminococcus sp. zg-921]